MPEELAGEGSSSSGHDFRAAEAAAASRPSLDALSREQVAAIDAATAVREAMRQSPPKPVADLEGSLGRHSLIKVLFRLAVAEQSGLLMLRQGELAKEIYIVEGDPEHVASNAPSELFGQYLLQRGVISEGELSMALAMLPRYEGKLGSTLLALNLLRPVEVLRHLTNQVRQKLLNAFEWSERATFAYYQDVRCERESAPLGLDAFEVIGAGVLALPPRAVAERLAPIAARAPRAVSPPPVPPEVFRLGALPRQVFDRLDGRRTIAEQLKRFDDVDERDGHARMLHLLLETGLAKL
jgi:serine/threonine-protein kinase